MYLTNKIISMEYLYFLPVNLPLQFTFQSVSGSDVADLKNKLTQTRSSEFSDPTEIGILIPFPPTKSLLWRMFLFSPSGPATTVTSSNQYMCFKQLIISHKVVDII